MRMTMGMLIEMLSGKKLSCGSRLNTLEVKKVFRLDYEDGDPSDGLDGKHLSRSDIKYSKFKNNGDLTPFNKNFSLEKICKELKKMGYNEFGSEVMTNGQTGEPMKCLIYVGVCYYQRLKHMVIDKVHCLTADHEVLTWKGWKSIHDLKMTDEVATLVNGELKYQCPTKILRYPNYKGKVYHIENSQIDLKVTMEHRMYVSKRGENNFKPMVIKDIIGEDIDYKKNAIWNVPPFKFEGVENVEKWLIFIGICMTKGAGGKIKSVYIYRMDHEYIHNLVKEIGLDYTYNEKKGSLHIIDERFDIEYINGGHPWLRMFPKWVWKLSSNQCRFLIKGLVFGGNEDFGINFYTQSESMANDFIKLCLHAGWSCTKQYAPNQHRDADWSLVEPTLELKIDKNEFATNYSHIRQFENIYDISEEVFCLQMPSEIFYVRRNGRSVWTCNSRSRGGHTLLTRQPKEGDVVLLFIIVLKLINKPLYKKGILLEIAGICLSGG